MRHLQVSPTPSQLLRLREKVAMRHTVEKSKVSEQKLRIISLYEKIQRVNQSDPLYNMTSSDVAPEWNAKMSDIKKQMRKTQAQNQKLDRYSTLVNSYIQQLDSPIKKQNSDEQIKADCHKMSILKTLLSKYNSRFLGQGNYLKLINSFGLQIQPMKNLKRFRTTSSKYKSKGKLQNMTETGTLSKDKYRQYRTTMKLDREKSSRELKQLQLVQMDTNNQQTQPFSLNKNFFQQAKEMYKTSTLPQKDVRFKKSSYPRKGVSQTTSKRGSCPEQIKYSSKGEAQEHNFQNRLCKYRQFLFMINFSNGVYRNLEIQEYPKPLKFYIGRGNNSNLIRSVMSNRFWWEESSLEEANFVWSQIKVDTLFDSQSLFMEEVDYCEVESESSRRYDVAIVNPLKKGVKMLEPELPERKLLSQTQYSQYLLMWKNHNSKAYFFSRIKHSKSTRIQQTPTSPDTLHNHLPRNELLGNKKAMFYSLREYYRLTNRNVFDIVPLTYHIQSGEKDPQFKEFVQEFNKRKLGGKTNIWIIKPGQFTNRGNGISCSNKLKEIRELISRKIGKKNQKRTFILQAYLTRPLLYHRRKFDIRAYMLLTSVNGIVKGYWYQDGYVRTSSSFFDLGELDDPMIHLTNDAVQKNGDSYGRFEAGNKITYNQLQRYIESITNKIDFFTMIYPEMRRIATDSIKSAAIHLDALKHQNNFQLFGLDFMIDQDYKPWLIEINTNPCLELSCGILERLIPHLVQNVIRMTVDPIFPPPNNYPFTKRYNVLQNAIHYNKFQLVYDELRDGKQLFMLYQNSKVLEMIGEVKEDQQIFQNDGEILRGQESNG